MFVECPECSHAYQTHAVGDVEACESCGERFRRFENSVQPAVDFTLKFAPKSLRTLALAQNIDRLAATVRYDDERGIEAGDTLGIIQSQTGDLIGRATVEHAAEVPARKAIDKIKGWFAEYRIEQPDELVRVLNNYYDDHITDETNVKVIVVAPEIDKGELIERQP